MDIRFFKMHAQGNDFVIVERDHLKLTETELSNLATDVCNRHFGLGADGLVLLNTHNPEMMIYNSDGSSAEICGSALRCCCWLISNRTGKLEMDIKTEAGILKGLINKKQTDFVTVEMSTPQMITNSMLVEGFEGDYINVGNPHFVIVSENLSGQPHLQYGEVISENSSFENGTNVEFVRVLSRQEIEILIWERGVGATLACGSGAVASVYSCQEKDLLDDKVKVFLPGGKIHISKKDGKYHLAGVTTFVAEGVFAWKT